MNRQLTVGAFISYITIGINIIMGLFYTPWMIHTIGDSEYALYSLALSVISIFMVDFGLSSATSRFLSNYYANNEENSINHFLGITMRLYLIIDMVLFFILAILFFFIEQIYVKLTPGEIKVFKGLYCIVAFYSILSFPLLNLNAVLMAKEKFISVKLCGLLQKLSTCFLIVCALVFGGNVYALVLANASTSIIFSTIKFFLVKKEGIKFDIHYRDRSIQKELFTFSIWNTIIQFMQRFIFNLAPTLLAMYVKSTEITYFTLASTIEGYVWIIGDAVNGMFMPKIARLNRESDAEKKIASFMCKVGRFQIFIIGMIVTAIGLFGEDFVLLWMGKGYEKVSICAVIITIPALMDIPQQVGKTAMVIRNKIRLEAVIYILMVVIYLPTAIFFIKKYGVIGISVAILIAYTIRSIIMTVVYQIKLGLKMKDFYISVYMKWIFAGIIVFFIEKILLNNITKNDYMGLILKAGVHIVIYVIINGFIFWNKEDREDVINKLKLR